jgi:DNA polymerase III psi subunit
MIEDENLKYFIQEDIYLLAEDQLATTASKVAEKVAVAPAVPIETKPMAETPKITKAETAPAPIEPIADVPKIPATPSIATPKMPQALAAPVMVHELVVLVLPMNNKDKELLKNLLLAIKKSEKDVHLINSFSELKVEYKKLISFGYLNELKYKLDLPLENYKWAAHQSSEILIASPLSALHDNRAEKTALWKCLQEKFL